MNKDQAIYTAVNWWSYQIREKVTEQQLSNFRSKLEEIICSEIATDLAYGYDGASIWLYCYDYPCEILGKAAVQSGFSKTIFPRRIDMRIESFDGGNHYDVTVYDRFEQRHKNLCLADEESEE